MNNFLKIAAAAMALVAATPSLATVYGPGAGFAIPDNNVVGASSTIAVGAGNGLVSSITVTLTGLNHTWAGDLVATLTKGATTITLFNRLAFPSNPNGSNNDFSGTYTFSDAGLTMLPETSNAGLIAPGVYQSAQSLSGFNGQLALGNWTLNISDRDASITGSLGSWSININPVAAAVPEPATWGMMIGGLALVGAQMRRRSTKVSFA